MIPVADPWPVYTNLLFSEVTFSVPLRWRLGQILWYKIFHRETISDSDAAICRQPVNHTHMRFSFAFFRFILASALLQN